MRHTTQIGKHIAMPIAAPSPLVGEGMMVVQHTRLGEGFKPIERM